MSRATKPASPPVVDNTLPEDPPVVDNTLPEAPEAPEAPDGSVDNTLPEAPVVIMDGANGAGVIPPSLVGTSQYPEGE